MKLEIGKYRINILDCGTFRLDGGAMFGVIPKTLWSKTNPADELNRITLGLNALLISGGGRKILIDAGIGNKLDEKYSAIYAVDNKERGVLDALAKTGTAADEITDIIITHLHFDHCGGFCEYENGVSKLLFNNADIYLQKRHLEAAIHPTERDRASFIKDNIEPIINSPRLKLIDGEVKNLFEGISLKPFNGHTPAMQTVIIESEGKAAYYLSDLAPTSSHVPIPYIMGYDLFPLTIIEEKKAVFNEIIQKDAIALFEHDPLMPAAKILKTEKGYKTLKFCPQ